MHCVALQVAVLVGLAGLPWVVKPLYGFLSDSVPLFGYRRRSYLILCGLAGATCSLQQPGVQHVCASAASAAAAARGPLLLDRSVMGTDAGSLVPYQAWV